MKHRLPLALSLTALAIAMFGSTSIGHAVSASPRGDAAPKGASGVSGDEIVDRCANVTS